VGRHMRDAERVVEVARQSLQAKGVKPTKEAVITVLSEMVVVLRRGFSAGFMRSTVEERTKGPMQEPEAL
jgi:hypothetical protein